MVLGRDTRESLMKHDGMMGWDSPVIKCSGRITWEQMVNEMEKFSFHSFYADSSHGGNTTYVAAGTLHEVARGQLKTQNQPEVEEAAVTLDRDQGVQPGLLRSGAGYQRITVVGPEPQPDQEQPAVEEIATGVEQSWIGVGVDKGKFHGKIVLTDMGDSMAHALKDPEDKSGAINPNMAKGIYNYLVGGGALAMASATSRGSDWRELGLRTTLYEDLRERRFTQPTGVDWAIAQKKRCPD